VRPASVIVALLVLGACSQPGQESAPMPTAAEDEAAIRAKAQEYDQASNAEDIEAMMALYLDGAVRMNPNMPASVGKEAIRDYYLASWAGADDDVTNEVVGVQVSGDLASAWGTWGGRIVPADGSEPYDDQGKWSATFLRQPDGSWKALWEMWNSDLPPRLGS